MGMNKDFPYVHDFIDARGNRRYVFRRKGFKTVTVKGKYKSAEFHRHYGELLAQTEPKTIGHGKAKSGTVDAVVLAWLKNDVFTKGLAKETQASWRRIIERFSDHVTAGGRRYGDNSIATINDKAVQRFLDGKTANAQKNSLKAVRSFVRFAIAEGELGIDPTKGVEPIKRSGPKSQGHMTWLEPQVAQYRERWPGGT